MVSNASRPCTMCGNPVKIDYWVFKLSAYCSFRCYALSSAYILLIEAIVFTMILGGSMIGLSFTSAPKALHIPFAIALALGPLPGFIISILGFKYRRESKIKPFVKVGTKEAPISDQKGKLECFICNEIIEKEDKVVKVEPCEHIFHRKHIVDWIDADLCPQCNKKIERIVLDDEDF